MLQFDADTAQYLEQSYVGADISLRRRVSFDALAPRPGDTVLDIGCGNGLLTAELARAVGPKGHVLGIDPSEDMRSIAQERCSGFAWVELHSGVASQLPFEDSSIDRAVAIQVFEYLDDVPAALAEAYRVLRPHGVLVISDTHFDSWVWHSDEPARMRRMMASWDKHVVDRTLPAHLPSAMKRAGLGAVEVSPFTLSDHLLRPDGLAQMIMRLMVDYAQENAHVLPDEAQAWYEEQLALAREGRFFFSLTQFVVRGVKR